MSLGWLFSWDGKKVCRGMGKGLDFRVDVVKELLLALDVQVLCLLVWTVIVVDCALPMGEDSRRMSIGVRWGVRSYHPCELAPVSSLPSLAGPKACCGSCFCLIHQLPTSASYISRICTFMPGCSDVRVCWHIRQASLAARASLLGYEFSFAEACLATVPFSVQPAR